ncbi:MAG: hypothetical protein U1F06_08705 [Steroidobacteraceae bacterium]
MRTSRNVAAQAATLGIAVLLLAGCGADHASARRARGGANPGAGVAAPGAAEDPDLNTAVSLSPSATLFGLKFKLAAAPTVGKPGVVYLVLVPTGNVAFDRVHMSLRPGEGLRLLSDSSLDSADTTAGEPVRYEIQVMPDAAGVLTLGVTLVVDAENNSLSRTYTIPLIAAAAKG